MHDVPFVAHIAGFIVSDVSLVEDVVSCVEPIASFVGDDVMFVAHIACMFVEDDVLVRTRRRPVRLTRCPVRRRR